MPPTRVRILTAFNAACVEFLRDIARTFPEAATDAFRTRYKRISASGDALMAHFARSTHACETFQRLCRKDLPRRLRLLPDVALPPAADLPPAFWAHVHRLLALSCAYQLDPAWMRQKVAAFGADANNSDTRMAAVAWTIYVRDVQTNQQALREVAV